MDWKIILKLIKILCEDEGRVSLCEHDVGPPYFINGLNEIDQLRDCRFFKEFHSKELLI